MITAHIVAVSFLLYFVGMLLHTVSRAGIAIGSQYTPWASTSQYVKHWWPHLIPLWFLGFMLFPLFWDNPSAYGLLSIPIFGDYPLVKIGLAGILGYFSDSILDKLLGLLHLEKKVISPDDFKDTPPS